MSQPPKTAKDVFLAALDADPAARAVILDDLCAGDVALRRQVEVLLQVHDEPDSLLDGPRIDLGLSAETGVLKDISTIDQPISEALGTVIGPYKLLQKIGEGGFGAVYLADQMGPVTYYQGHVVLWDAATGNESRRFVAPPLLWLDFSPEGKRLAAGHRDGTVRLWAVETGTELYVYKGHSQWLYYVGFSPDGSRLVSVARDLNAKVWPVQARQPLEALTGANSRHFRKPGRDRVAVSPDGELLAGLQSFAQVGIVDVRSGCVRATLNVGAGVHAIVFSPDGKCLAVARSGGLQIWKVDGAKRMQERPTDSALWTVAFSPGGRSLAVGAESNQVEIWRADTLETENVLPWDYKKPLRKVAFSPDGKTLAVTTIGPPMETQLWDVDPWHLRASYEGAGAGHSECSTDLAFSPDGKTLAVSQGTNFQPHDGAATRLFDVATGRETATLRGDDALHLAVTFSSDGSTLATASENGEITLWDRGTLEERMTLTWEGANIESSEWSSFIESMAFSPDGRTLVSSDANARVWPWRSAGQDRVDQRERAGLQRRRADHAGTGRSQENPPRSTPDRIEGQPLQHDAGPLLEQSEQPKHSVERGKEAPLNGG